MQIFCFGDSHSRYFKHANTLAWSGVFTSTSPLVTAFDYVAASARGFAAGPKSRFAYRRFMLDLKTYSPEFICLAYGQVDAEVGYYYRKYVTGKTSSPEADLTDTYSSYVRVAAEVLPDQKVVFKGPNPSTLRIDTQLLSYAFRRMTVRIPDHKERDRIWKLIHEDPPSIKEHARINCMARDILEDQARRAGFGYFDVRPSIEDPETPGMVRWSLMPAENDVHVTDSYLVRKAYATRLFESFGAVSSNS